MERCRSGLTGGPGKTVYQKWYREFESRPLRSGDFNRSNPGFCEEQKSAPAWRAGLPARVREFESHTLRQLGKCKFLEDTSRRGTRRSARI